MSCTIVCYKEKEKKKRQSNLNFWEQEQQLLGITIKFSTDYTMLLPFLSLKLLRWTKVAAFEVPGCLVALNTEYIPPW